MKHKWLPKVGFVLAAVLALAMFLPACSNDDTSSPTTTVDPDANIKNPDTFTIASIGSPDTLDPAAAYDNASGEAILIVYETLIMYDETNTTKFVPVLATEWTVSPDGKTYRFHIRQNVKFSNGNALTPSDVEYSFERGMVQDYIGSPQWMIFEPIFGSGIFSGDLTLAQITNAINVDGEWVQFNLVAPYEPFLQILCGSWGCIVDKEWCIQQGDWDGTQASFDTLNDPAPNDWPLQKIMMGTGPWSLEYWDQASEISFVKNANYWRTPANFNRVVIKTVEEWTTRKLMLQNGDADWVYVPMENYPEMVGLQGMNVYEKLPNVSLDGFFFVYDISTTSPYIGSGNLDGAGIPTDFFTDINVRKGFEYSFNWTTYITDVLGGNGFQPASPVVNGLAYYNPALTTKYSFDKVKAEAAFRAAWGGQIWEKGFTMVLAYNSGNTSRKTACDILAANINALNPKFHITVAAQEWSSYSAQFVHHTLPCFQIGWLPDYMDAHNFIVPWMATYGYFSQFQGWSTPEIDALIAQGIGSNVPATRQAIYDQLAQIYFDQAPGILLVQPSGNRYFKDWVKGFYFNPALPSSCGNIYALSKTYK
ncbi:ABC transporter [Dehalogenimonas sp. WBC-2]|nr:ABC transporter [Dehalogenimonas sp. WBC-2]